MKFKKRDLSEQLGMTKSNKKTFTKDAKQKIVVSERQLQRLLGRINEETPLPPKQKPKPAPRPNQSTVSSKPKPKPTKDTPPKFNFSKWSSEFKSKIDNFISNGNLDGAKKFLDGRVAGWSSKSKKAGPKWKNQLTQKIGFGKKMLTTVTAAKKKKPAPRPNQPTVSSKPTKDTKPTKPVDMKEAGGPNNKKCCRCKYSTPYSIPNTQSCPPSCPELDCKGVVKEQQYMHYMCEPGTCQCVSTYGVPPTGQQYFSLQDCQSDTSNCCKTTSPTSPLKGKCCKCRGKVMVTQKHCPKSCPEVPCKGTPPTQGNITTESRQLKTTHPINETDIRNMKKWFNRVNKTGTNYNPSID